MIRRPLLALCLASAALPTSPAHAGDARLVTRSYNANEVVRIEGHLSVQAAISFGEGELIENVAVGDSAAWQITPNKRADVLFVKPLAGNARTNMTVLTSKRTYFFDLVASAGAKPVYMLRFAYADEKPKAVATANATPPLSEAESAVLTGDAGAAPVDPATLNFAWTMQGAERLLPARIYDDGLSTYLQLGARQTTPAILIRDEKGAEGPVNFAVRGDTIVIDAVPGLIVLRSGKAMATLRNARPTPARAAPTAPPAVAVATVSPEKK